MSPARSWHSPSHAAGSHDWLPPKIWVPGHPERRDRWIQFAQSLLTHQPRAGCICLVLEAFILPSINEFISPAKDQHGFRPRHSTTSALLQLTTDIETGFNQWKPPHRTVYVAIDLTAAFDIMVHEH